jgi:hypothetical protein
VRLLLSLAFGECCPPGPLTIRGFPSPTAIATKGLKVPHRRCCDHGEIETNGRPDEPPSEEPRTRRFDSWRRRSAIGAVATGVALGLKDIFQPTNIEPVITAEAPGDPPDSENRLRVILDPDDPSKSVAIVPPASGDASV